MRDSPPSPDSTHRSQPNADPTPWQRLADADPIRIRDPLAELLGMVSDGDPLVVTFADVAKAAGHACPAVAGAYRATQLALEYLYPEALPRRGDVSVRVGGDPDASGLGPMASVIRHVTGAADETGFSGFGGYGGRQDLLSFGSVPGPGRSFAFTRVDTKETVRVSFDPSGAGIDPSDADDAAAPMIPELVQGEASVEARRRFYEEWHDRIQRVIDADPGPESPFTLEKA